jgi:hypothetical protein
MRKNGINSVLAFQEKEEDEEHKDEEREVNEDMQEDEASVEAGANMGLVQDDKEIVQDKEAEEAEVVQEKK